MRKEKILFKKNDLLTHTRLNGAINYNHKIDTKKMYKLILRKFYKGNSLSECEELRKKEIEFIITYLETDEMVDELGEE